MTNFADNDENAIDGNDELNETYTADGVEEAIGSVDIPMTRSSYTGWHARAYDRLWRRYTAITQQSVLDQIDWSALKRLRAGREEPLRLLDVACGTGTLLAQVLERLPESEAYGVDASAAMLALARTTLAARFDLTVHLAQATIVPGATAGLDLPRGSFDLITCANALHYFAQPGAVLAGLRNLLAPEGQLIVEDYAPHGPRPLWAAFELLVRLVDRGHTRAYTLAEARQFAGRAGLRVVADDTFVVNAFWHGWALRATAMKLK